MTAHIIDGKKFAEKVRAKVADHVTRLKEENGITPAWRSCWSGMTPPAMSMSGTSKNRPSRSA